MTQEPRGNGTACPSLSEVRTCAIPAWCVPVRWVWRTAYDLPLSAAQPGQLRRGRLVDLGSVHRLL